MRDSEQAAFRRLETWSRDNCGVSSGLHPSVEVYHDEATGFSLRIKKEAPQGLGSQQPVVTCRLSSTISYLNAAVDGPISTEGPEQKLAFPPRFLDAIPPHVIGRFFLIHEYIRGRDSHWWPYISTLPQPDRIASWALPAFWPAEDVSFLEGTNAGVAIEEIQRNVKKEFKEARKILKAEGFEGWRDYSRLLYNWAFCIYTSRSFRPSLVLSEGAKAEVRLRLPLGCDLDDFSILQPLFDIANHSPSASVTWDTNSDPAECRLICKDEYLPGQQVFNNYGQKTNSELLLGYNFLLPKTDAFHNDYIHVRKREQTVDGTSGGDATAPGSSAKPKDFLVSLRPMGDPSSVAGRSRRLVQDPAFQALPQFAHFEDALVWDIASTVMEEAEWAIIRDISSLNGNADQKTSIAEYAKVLLGSPTRPGLEGLVSRIRNVLGAKLHYELDKLSAGGQDDDDGSGEASWELGEASNQNQELALAYRQRCRLVLEAAMRSLSAE